MTFDQLITDFMRLYHQTYIRYIIRIGKVPRETAEDLAMNAYESALRYQHSYKSETYTFTTYMMGIARIQVARYYKHGFNYWSSKDQHKDLAVVVDNKPRVYYMDDSIIREEMIVVAQVFSGELRSTIHKKIINLFISGLSLVEIAKAMNKTYTNIKCQWNNIIVKAREWFLKKGHHSDILESYI